MYGPTVSKTVGHASLLHPETLFVIHTLSYTRTQQRRLLERIKHEHRSNNEEKANCRCATPSDETAAPTALTPQAAAASSTSVRAPPAPPLEIDLASVRDVDELQAMGTPRLKAALKYVNYLLVCV